MIALKNRHEWKKSRDEKTADVNENIGGSAALQEDADTDLFDVVNTLLEARAKVDIQNQDKQTPLMIAIEEGHEKISEIFIEIRKGVEKQNKRGETALHLAAKTGRDSIVNKLLKTDADFNVETENGWTPLMMALKHGQHDIASILIGNGVDSNKIDKLGNTTLHFAAETDHSGVVEELIKAGAKVDTQNHEHKTPLMIAIKNGCTNIAKLLIMKTEDVNKKNIFGDTALHLAAEGGHLETVEQLANACADVETKSNNDLTPLMIASKNGRDKIANFLIQNNVVVNTTAKCGKTALHFAADSGNINVVNTLMGTGAEVDIPDKEHMTPLLTAAYNNVSNAEEIIRTLILKGARLNNVNKDGMTALMLAAYSGQLKSLNALIEAGAEINTQRKKDGETALTLVREELILIRLVQRLTQKELFQKTRFLREENVRAQLNSEQSVAKHRAPDLTSVIEKACNESFSEYEKDQMRKELKQVPVYKDIRDSLLRSGGYNVRNIKNPNTRTKIKYILRWSDEKVLKRILKKVAEENIVDAVGSMFELLAGDEDLVTWWTLLFNSLPNKKTFFRGKFLHSFAEAGNAEVLGETMVNVLRTEHQEGPNNDTVVKEFMKKNKLGNTFLYTFAQKHSLNDLFQEISKKELKRHRVPKTIENLFESTNMKGYTFLAVAVNQVDSGNSKQGEKELIEALYRMAVMFGQEIVSNLCKKTDNGSNSLLHLAVRKSLMELVSFILPKTPKADEIINADGYNPLHLAVEMNSTDMVRSISQQENFNVNICMRNGETALHMAAQLGYDRMLGELIEQGGNLSFTDDEDGHTPLHDCLQQVYFESRDTEEKYRKFVSIWQTIVDNAVRWWCRKHKTNKSEENVEPPANGSKEYLELQRKAVYYLRSCIKNYDGLSVLQFAADRGLTMCVQVMLSTKDVFVRSQEKREEIVHEIDVTNLCREYFVQKSSLFSPDELKEITKDEKERLKKMRAKRKINERTGQPKHEDGTLQPEQVDRAPELQPEQVDGAPEPQPEHVDGAPEPEPEHVDGAPEPEPEHVDGAPGPQPEQVDGAPEPQPEHVDGAPQPEPEHIDGAPEPEPEHVDGAPEPEPEHVDGAPELQPEQVDGAPELQPEQVEPEVVSFLDALAEVKPPNKAGEVLESIPMMKLTELEWNIRLPLPLVNVSLRVHELWMMVHVVLMLIATIVLNVSKGKVGVVVGGVTLIYGFVITFVHVMVRLGRSGLCELQKPSREQVKQSIKESIKKYEKKQDDKVNSFIFNQTILVLEILFTISALAVFISKMIGDYVWIDGLFLLFGWLMLLIPMASFERIYKLISVLQYIISYDMFPWILMYIPLSVGFATAIKLQFNQLPTSPPCVDGQPELSGFLHQPFHAIYELIIMTAGLDTDIKGVRSLECLFESRNKDVFVISLLITTYAVISAVILLNMLIAIMSNTVTVAQQDKGWRQYQISQSLWIREAFDETAKIYCCCCQSGTNPRSPPTDSYPNVNYREVTQTDDDAMRALGNAFLDRRIRGDIPETWNTCNVRYDRQARRWYLKLGAFDVKEIRAKIWQCPNDSDQ